MESAVVERRRQLAWKAHREGDLQQAERHYRELLDQSPSEADAVNLGALWRQQGRLREAAKLYNRWLPRFPDALQLHLNAANCLHDVEDHAACIRGRFARRRCGRRAYPGGAAAHSIPPASLCVDWI